MMIFKDLIKRLNSSEPLVITGHIDPDADAVCSMLAVFKAFNGKQKGWKLLLQDRMPEYLDFLPGYEEISLLDSSAKNSDMLLVDCNELSRANRIGMTENDFREIWVIDHHISDALQSPNRIIKPESAACCELIYQLIKTAGAEIDAELALILYTGLVGDTGCFKQANTTSQTFAVAADLLSYDIDTETVRIRLFEQKSLANLKLIGKALANMESYFENQLCFLTISLSDKEAVNAGPDDCISIVGQSLALKGVKIGVFFEERENNKVKLSFRSRKGFDVRAIAEHFGGGGHILAAGATVEGKLDNIKSAVKSSIAEKYFFDR